MKPIKTAVKPWYSRRARRLKVGLWATSMLLLAILVFMAWAASRYSLQGVVKGDDYMLMTEKQAKECKEGGGCAIWSEREFLTAMSQLLERNKRQNWRSDL